jgi:hypothetical protein
LAIEVAFLQGGFQARRLRGNYISARRAGCVLCANLDPAGRLHLYPGQTANGSNGGVVLTEHSDQSIMFTAYGPMPERKRESSR